MSESGNADFEMLTGGLCDAIVIEAMATVRSPHLTEIAQLALSNSDLLLVFPEIDPQGDTATKYVFANSRVLTEGTDDEAFESIDDEGAEPESRAEWLSRMVTELMDSPSDPYVPGFALLVPDSQLVFGREAAPLMEFSEDVAAKHIAIASAPDGLYLEDRGDKASALILSQQDRVRFSLESKGSSMPQEFILSLFNSFKVNRRFPKKQKIDSHGTQKMSVHATVEYSYEPGAKLPRSLQIVISKAPGFNRLTPARGYDIKRIIIDPSKPDIVVADESTVQSKLPIGTAPRRYLMDIKTADELMLLSLMGRDEVHGE
ncbi:MAG TPA: hypothetical protein VL989_00565 [Candidatus Sulfotelmatobacter sp.]|nr:hypothetical protein [Candidatus Sulfotelmatobacter sp.]